MTSPIRKIYRKFTPSALERLFAARRALGEDFFGGWVEEDAALFARHRRPAAPRPGKFTDFLGIVTDVSCHPWAAEKAGSVNAELPIPDDGIRAEAIEYVAMLHSFETSGDSFSFAEIGASHGPWACVAAVLADRAGKRSAIRAVEASSTLFPMIEAHLKDNGVLDRIDDLKLFQGAVAAERGTLYFPKVESGNENGGRAEAAPPDSTYVGTAVEHEKVQAYVLEDILADRTDLLHIDVQGFEAEVVAASAELLDETVRSVFIGTHSRKIEGQLLEHFHGRGWQLVRERPTKFLYRQDLADITGWTTRDGGQYWINPRLS